MSCNLEAMDSTFLLGWGPADDCRKPCSLLFSGGEQEGPVRLASWAPPAADKEKAVTDQREALLLLVHD